MKALDICCGDGGWTDGLMEAGFEVTGIDLERMPGFKGKLIVMDALELTADLVREFDAVLASPPCQEFSVWGMRHFHPNPPWPTLGIGIFEHVRRICEESGRPYVIENVRSAQKFVGKAVSHAGPFYLWGNSVPAILPYSDYRKHMTQRRKGHPQGCDESMYWDKRKRSREKARIPATLSRAVAASLLRLAQNTL